MFFLFPPPPPVPAEPSQLPPIELVPVPPPVAMPPPWPPPPWGYPPYYPYPPRGGWDYRPPVRMTPARIVPYREGSPVPAGYHLDTRIRKGFAIGGGTTFASLWLVSLAVAAAFQSDEDAADELSPLFAPLVGPFVALGTSNAEPIGAFALVVDGLGQAVGLALFVVGFTAPETVWVRDEQARIRLTPIVTPDGTAALGIRGEL
jgi:hypothetical protein